MKKYLANLGGHMGRSRGNGEVEKETKWNFRYQDSHFGAQNNTPSTGRSLSAF